MPGESDRRGHGGGRTFEGEEAVRLARAYAAPEIAEQRVQTRAAIGARPGEHGLDVGCGPGYLARELGAEVRPGGRIVGVDISADLLGIARRQADAAGVASSVHLARGSATALPFPSRCFDFVVGVQVLLHVPTIESALAEAARVLRPGGRLVVVDTDWDACVWLTSDRDRHRRIMEARRHHYAHDDVPRRLPGLLPAAGFHLDDVRVIPIINLRYDPDSFSADVVATTVKTAPAGGVPREDVEAWAADLTSRTREGEYFFCLSRFLFVATRR